MPFKAFKRIFYGPAKLKKLPEKELDLRNDERNHLEYKGTYVVPMQLLGRKVMLNLVVLEHVHENILGIHFIHQHD